MTVALIVSSVAFVALVTLVGLLLWEPEPSAPLLASELQAFRELLSPP